MADPMKKALVQIQGVFAELEKSLLVKKLRAARERKKAATGKCEGRKGYDETDHGQKRVIHEIKKLRRKRKGIDSRMSFDRIADELNRKRYRTASGGMFTGNNVLTILYRRKTARD